MKVPTMTFELRPVADGRRFEAIARDDALDLYIYDEIGRSWDGGVPAKDVINTLDKHKAATRINLYINSPGGSVFDALAIYNALTRHAAEVYVYIDGVAASAASVVAMAGDTIAIAENALMMLHDPTGFVIGTAVDMRKMATVLDTLRQTLVDTYAARSNVLDAEQVSKLMAAETWFDAAEAVKNGLADEVTASKRVAAICGDLTRYHNVPEKLKAAQCSAAQSIPQAADEPAVPKEAQTMSAEQTTAADAPVAKDTQAVKPATLAELKMAFPDPKYDAAFRETCMDRGFTLAQATSHALDQKELEVANRNTELEEARAAAKRPSGVKPVVTSGNAASDEAGDPIARWDSLIADRMAAGKRSKADAIRAVVHAEPELHKAYIEAYNTQARQKARVA